MLSRLFLRRMNMSKKIVSSSLIVAFGLVICILLFASTRGGDQKTISEAQDNTRYTNDPRSIRSLILDEGVASSIDRNEIISGGVPKDGIPSIDQPVFVSVNEMPAWLERSGDGIFYEADGVAHFYPYQILVRHEIVNDTIAEKPVLVTYCPLCYTGIVFERTIEGQEVEFGVSGVLHHSNLLMYNRSEPESLWAQASGDAVVGPATGSSLTILPFDITTLEEFVASFPDGEVLVGGDGSGPLGQYQGEVYGGDLRNPDLRFPNPGEADDRLEPTARVVGLVLDGEARAYHIEAVERSAPFEDEVAGRALEVDWDQSLGAVRVFEVVDGVRSRLPLSASFWFSWVSTYPDTSLFK